MKLFFFLFLFSLYGRYFISFKSNYNLSDFDFNLMATLVKKFSKAVIESIICFAGKARSCVRIVQLSIGNGVQNSAHFTH